MTPANPPGFSIRIFLPDGTPDGLRLVEKSNWSGLGVVCPRSVFAEKKGAKEFTRTGLYVLIGPSEGSELPRVYVGQGDSVRPRLESHHAIRDIWTTAIFFVSKDENLNRAHVQYLEAELVRLAGEAHRCELDNGNKSERPSLSPADEADVQTFLDEILLCFHGLGRNGGPHVQRPHRVAGLGGAHAQAAAVGGSRRRWERFRRRVSASVEAASGERLVKGRSGRRWAV